MYTNILSAATALITMIREVEGYADGDSRDYGFRVSAHSGTVERVFKGLRRAVRADKPDNGDIAAMMSLRNTNLGPYVIGINDEIIVNTDSISLNEIIDCLMGIIDFILVEDGSGEEND